MHQSVLFLLHSFETLEVNDQDGRGPEDLELLHSLLVHFATRTEPGVLVRQLFRRHELPETVIDGNLIILEQVQRGTLCRTLWVDLRIFSETHQIFVKGPTLVGIETNLELEFKVVSLIFLLWCAR